MSMVRAILPLSLLLALSVTVGGCSQIQDAVGKTKKAPDEFQVVNRAPLSLPPNFDLKPPQPGAVRPQEGTTSDRAAEKILGRKIRSTTLGSGQVTSSTVAAAPTQTQSSFNQQLGLGKADPNIRQVVDAETDTFVYETKYPIDYLLFWTKDGEKGVVLDPKKEQQRLRENAALGRAADTGTTPTIKRRNRSVLEKLF